MSDQKSPINLYSTAHLKSTSDDQIPSILKQLGYKRDFQLENVRLLIGYLSIITAALCGYWDYFVGFNKRFVPIAMSVVVYFALSGVYTLWTWKVERGLVYSGIKGKSKVNIRTKGKKYSPDYCVEIEECDLKDNTLNTKNLAGQFNSWFDNRGFIIYSKFQQFINDAVTEGRDEKTESKKTE